MSEFDELVELVSNHVNLPTRHVRRKLKPVIEYLQNLIDNDASFYSVGDRKGDVVAIQGDFSVSTLKSVWNSGRTLAFALPGEDKLTKFVVTP